MEKSATSPDEFLASLDRARDDMVLLDALISDVMDGWERHLWEGVFWGGSDQKIIGYGDFTYDRPSGPVDWFVVGLAAQKNYLSVYVNVVDEGVYLGELFVERLGKVKKGAASLSFKSVGDLDLEVFREMMVRARDLTA
jgi:hypothetical protein